MTKEQQIKILDAHFQGCLSFWKLNANNEITAFELALNDLRDTWRNPYAPEGEMLDRQVTLEVCAKYTSQLDNLYREYYENQKETWHDDHIRRCTECGKPMKEGYLIEQGGEYYCSDECLHKNYTQEQWNCLCCQDGDEEICNNPDYDWDDKETSDENYYTAWESIYQY